MKKVNVYPTIGFLILVICVLFIPKSADMFDKLFGIGIGLFLPLSIDSIVAAVKNLRK